MTMPLLPRRRPGIGWLHMLLLFIIILLMVWASRSMAAPFAVSDPYPAASTPKPTHCGVYLDTAAKVEIPVTVDATGTYCKIDLSAWTVGTHTLKATHIIKNTGWSDVESGYSGPLVQSRPGIPSAPSGITLVP